MSNETKNQVVPKLRFPEFKSDGVWEEKRIYEVCEVNPLIKKLPERFVYIDLESVEDGILLQKKIIQLSEAPSRAQRLLKDGDVIYQMVRPYQKNNYFFKPDDELQYVASTGYAQLRAYDSKMYLFQYLHNQNFVDKVLAKCSGSNYPAINSSDLSEILIEIPKPNEQQKIADCLSSLDELITVQSQKLETLQAHKKGLMQQLFPVEGEAVPKSRFKEFRDYGDWEEKILGDIFNFKQGVQCAVEEQNLSQSEGWVRFIRIVDLTKNDEPKRYVKDPGTEHHIDSDDLFMVRYGTPGVVGYNYKGVIANNLFRIIPKLKKNIHNRFYFFVFNHLQSNILSLASSSTMPALNFTTLSNLIVPYPIIKEQQKIADSLSSLDELITAQTEKIEVLRKHKKGLMQGLFPNINEIS